VVGAHQNLNGSDHLTTPLSGQFWFVIRGLALAMINLTTKFEVCIASSSHYKDTKGDTKYRKWGGLG